MVSGDHHLLDLRSYADIEIAGVLVFLAAVTDEG
jgi:hypothetical protein